MCTERRWATAFQMNRKPNGSASQALKYLREILSFPGLRSNELNFSLASLSATLIFLLDCFISFAMTTYGEISVNEEFTKPFQGLGVNAKKFSGKYRDFYFRHLFQTM